MELILIVCGRQGFAWLKMVVLPCNGNLDFFFFALELIMVSHSLVSTPLTRFPHMAHNILHAVRENERAVILLSWNR